MRSLGLAVFVVGALLVVGYAIYSLMGPTPPRPARVDGPAGDRAAASADAPGEPVGRPGGVRPAAVSGHGNARRPHEYPPPPPPVPLPQAREQFATLLAELDRLAAEGTELTSPQWVDYYKRGQDALAPLLRQLDPADPAQAEELRQANVDLREKLQAIDPGQASASPPPTP